MVGRKAIARPHSVKSIIQPFPMLSVFLVLTFATGGSSWPYEGQLILLRPVSVLFAMFGLATMRPDVWCRFSPIWIGFVAIVLLLAAHLLPLPYTWWSALPGRELLTQIDQAAGFGAIARPLSMHPEATVNALFSLFVPLAVLALGAQLRERDHRRLAGLVATLVALSAFCGLLQLSGIPISIYQDAVDVGAPGLFNNRNHQGAALAIAIPLAAVAWRGGYLTGLPHRLERGAAVALVAMILPLAIITGSRSGLVLTGIAFTAVLLPLLWVSGRAASRKATVLKVMAMFAAVGVIGVAAYSAGRTESIDRLTGSAEDLRYPVWQSIVADLPTYWPWGSGIGTYADAYAINEPDALLRPQFSNHAHNEYLEVVYTGGLPAVIGLGLAAVALCFGIAGAFRIKGDLAVLPRAGAMVILLLAIASLSDYPVRTPIMSAVLALSALWLAQIRTSHKPDESRI